MPITRSAKAAFDDDNGDGGRDSIPGSPEKRQVHKNSFSVNGSRVSGSSRGSNSSRANLLMIELKERHMREIQADELREFQAKQRRELLRVQQELEVARLAEKIKDRASIRSLESDDCNERVRQFVLKHPVDKGVEGPVIIDREGPLIGQPCEDKEVAVRVSPVATSSELPRVELIPFDGRPTTYWKFIRQFDIYVASKVLDDGRRLMFLLHYCKGKAREAIEECIMLPPEAGYSRARDILRDLFGRAHEVSRSLLDGLMEGYSASHGDAEGLSRLAIRMENCMIALEQMDYTADLNSLATLEQIVRKLPYPLQREWAKTVDRLTQNVREPTFAELTEFVSSMARVARSRFGQLADRGRVTMRANHATNNPGRRQSGMSFAVNSVAQHDPVKKGCLVCSGDHSVPLCSRFLALETPMRWKEARSKGMCFVCLKGSHRSSECRTNNSCNVAGCRGRHHHLLHFNAHSKEVQQEPNSDSHCAATRSQPNGVCLGLVPVRLRAGSKEVTGYAFLDNGSDTTLICAETMNHLGLGSRSDQITIRTVGGSQKVNSVSDSFEVVALDGTDCINIDQAVVIDALPIPGPDRTNKERLKNWPHLSDLPLKEVNGNVLLLIGCDIPEAHWALDQRLGGRKHPYAVRTLLGWVIFGPTGYKTYQSRSINCVLQDDLSPLEHLQRIYDAEFADVQSLDLGISSEDAEAVALVEGGVRLEDGRFTVPLPWKKGISTGSGNYDCAITRLRSLKRRLTRDEDLRVGYTRAMEQAIEKGYAAPVSVEQKKADYQPRWYLPHHPVVNPKKPGKLRIVLDCAAKYMGRSLNDMLYQGPDTTADLVSILLRFRREAVAISADIEEMFMQVKVPVPDRGALRFLWWPRGELSEDPREYQMTSHPFGATSSPFCANFALRQTAKEFGADYDQTVSESIGCNFYVDDCLKSFASSEEAITFVKQISEMLLRGGFRLRKWVSNSNDVAETFPETEREPHAVRTLLSTPIPQRALGLEWDTVEDVLKFQFCPTNKSLTRRGILSTVSSLFDPLGLVAPLCLPAKLLLQGLCKANVGWDQPLGSADVSSWEEWTTLMQNLGEVKVPRGVCRLGRNSSESIELHVFCDASECGYGAVAYAWHIPHDRPQYSVLLFSKSRVAPIKTVTIPRLELSAAVLGVRLGAIIKRALPMLFNKICFWTDSMIVLYYIRNTDRRFSTFVTNRLAVIHQFSSVTQWQHVSSGNNIADLTSRGIRTEKELRIWLEGPTFLSTQEPSVMPLEESEPPEGIEMKKSAYVHASVSFSKVNAIFSRYSEWSKLLKAVAWLIRFTRYIQVMYSKDCNKTLSLGSLSVEEIDNARIKILKLTQAEIYGSLTGRLLDSKRGGKGPHSTLKKLCPIAIQGLLCVGGRLNYSDYPAAFKHPVILPNRHAVTDLIIRHHHSLEGHSGTSQVLASIRKKYWIVKGNSAVRRAIGQCVTCRRLSAVVGRQLMAPLPLCRVQKGWHCFNSVGVDYFGPLFVRRGRGTEKRYGCLFTCLQTRAVHIELTVSLNTDSFLMALMRFIGRRGTPTEIYSDNGSNFVGAVSELRRQLKNWDESRINDRLASQDIRWNFNPPSSSHRGGVWERMIRSVRRLLLVLSREQVKSEERLLTCLVEAERILNNRPLVPLLSDDRDRPALTPSSLLLLRDDNSILADVNLHDNYNRRWKQVNQFANTFWRRWMREYLPLLQSRQKWLSKCRNFKEGDVVLVASESTARGRWPMGVVESCEASNDGLTRTVIVRTNEGRLRRDVRKICLLEGAD